jgi:hypothetical protein
MNSRINRALKRYLKQAGINKQGFRSTLCAIAMWHICLVKVWTFTQLVNGWAMLTCRSRVTSMLILLMNTNVNLTI